MTFGFIRALFVLISAVVGYQLGTDFHGVGSFWSLGGIAIGVGLALFIILIEMGLGKLSLRGLSAAVFGLILALIVSRFLTGAIDLIPDLDPAFGSSLNLVLFFVLSFFGMVFAGRGGDEFNLIIPKKLSTRT